MYDYGFRIYNPSIARFLSTDPLAKKYPAWSPYTYVLGNPVKFTDPDGRYVRGAATTALSKFLKVFRMWEVEAEKIQYRAKWYGHSRMHYEGTNHAKLRIFDRDFGKNDQLINEVGGRGGFSYNNSFGKYVNVGLPLDVAHFFKMASLAQDIPNSVVRYAYEREEFKQAMDPRPDGRTSAFAPEDLFSNELGVIFGSSLGVNAEMGEELGVFLTEVNTLFTTNTIEGAKYLTGRNVDYLRYLAETYYGTDDLRIFQKDSDIYTLDVIRGINNNAASGTLPLTGTPASQEN